MVDYTEQDIDKHLEYATALWGKVLTGFQTDLGQISIEKVETDQAKKFMKDYFEAAKALVVPIKEHVFIQMLLPFYSWLYADCPLTDHKALEPPKLKGGI